jgi:hypothetical protein
MHASRLMQLLCGSGLPTRGYRFERATVEELNAMAQSLRAYQGAQCSDAPSVTLIEIDAEDAVHLVTRPGHFAHPSILHRRLAADVQGRYIDIDGHTTADDAIMQTWLRQFMEQDVQIQRALRPPQSDQDRPQ